jgi:hypothetical protein
VRVQSGQTGVSTTTSTPSSRRSFAAAGPESSSITDSVSGCWFPAKERCRLATASDHARVRQLAQTIHGKDDVRVVEPAAAIEVRALVTESHLARVRDHAKRRVAAAWRRLAGPVQRGSGHDGHACVGERGRTDERRLPEIGHRHALR